jgi:hypothetical protein
MTRIRSALATSNAAGYTSALNVKVDTCFSITSTEILTSSSDLGTKTVPALADKLAILEVVDTNSPLIFVHFLCNRSISVRWIGMQIPVFKESDPEYRQYRLYTRYCSMRH